MIKQPSKADKRKVGDREVVGVGWSQSLSGCFKILDWKVPPSVIVGRF